MCLIKKSFLLRINSFKILPSLSVLVFKNIFLLPFLSIWLIITSTFLAWEPSVEFNKWEEKIAIDYSIEALSLLSVTAATIGLITPFALTLIQEVLPLSIALFSAGINSSLLFTSSPCPPNPLKILWNGMSLKSVAKCLPLSNFYFLWHVKKSTTTKTSDHDPLHLAKIRLRHICTFWYLFLIFLHFMPRLLKDGFQEPHHFFL